MRIEDAGGVVTTRAGLPDLDHLRSLPDGSLSQAEVRWLCDVIDQLRKYQNAITDAIVDGRLRGTGPDA
jgi:hypothetical protein